MSIGWDDFLGEIRLVLSRRINQPDIQILKTFYSNRLVISMLEKKRIG